MRHVIFGLILLKVLSNYGQSNDKGIGVLYFSNCFNENKTNTDSIEIFDLSEKTKIGAFSFNTFSEKVFDLKIKDLMSSYLLEFDYEIEGLPIEEVISREKIKVILGKYSNNKIAYGIVHYDKNKLDYNLWTQILFNKPLYFINTTDIHFYESPNGKESGFTIKNLMINSEDKKYNYIMYPLEINQNWMKVEIVSPSDFCEFPDKTIKHTFWIKYLDSKRRPLAWYYTRGC